MWWLGTRLFAEFTATNSAGHPGWWPSKLQRIRHSQRATTPSLALSCPNDLVFENAAK
jgi:hypothetical protein